MMEAHPPGSRIQAGSQIGGRQVRRSHELAAHTLETVG